MNICRLRLSRIRHPKEILFLLVFILFDVQLSIAQLPFATWTNKELILNNGVVQRTILLPATTGKFINVSYIPVNTDFKYFTKTSPDFQFEANGNWSLKNIVKHTDTKQRNEAASFSTGWKDYI